MIWCSFVCFVLTFVGAVGPWAGVAGNCALRPQVPMRKLCATGSLAPISFSPSDQHLLPVLSPSHMSSDRSLHQFLLLCLLSSFLSYPERSVTRLLYVTLLQAGIKLPHVSETKAISYTHLRQVIAERGRERQVIAQRGRDPHDCHESSLVGLQTTATNHQAK